MRAADRGQAAVGRAVVPIVAGGRGAAEAAARHAAVVLGAAIGVVAGFAVGLVRTTGRRRTGVGRAPVVVVARRVWARLAGAGRAEVAGRAEIAIVARAGDGDPFAALARHACVVRAGVAVVAVGRRAAEALAGEAGIAARAGIAVVAGLGVRLEHAAEIGVAAVGRARVVVVAGDGVTADAHAGETGVVGRTAVAVGARGTVALRLHFTGTGLAAAGIDETRGVVRRVAAHEAVGGRDAQSVDAAVDAVAQVAVVGTVDVAVAGAREDARHASAARAGVADRAGVAVVAGTGLGREAAAQGRLTRVAGAGIAVVAGKSGLAAALASEAGIGVGAAVVVVAGLPVGREHDGAQAVFGVAAALGAGGVAARVALHDGLGVDDAQRGHAVESAVAAIGIVVHATRVVARAGAGVVAGRAAAVVADVSERTGVAVFAERTVTRREDTAQYRVATVVGARIVVVA